MAVRLLESFLSRPYHWFLTQNSAFLNRYLNMGDLAQHLLLPITEILSVTVLAVFILGALFLVDPWVALGTGVGVGVAHVALLTVTKKPFKRWSTQARDLLNERAILGHDAVSGYKPILSGACESHYVRRFSVVAERGSRLAGWRGMFWDIPRFFLEAIALSLILVLTLYFVIWGGQERLLPMLSLYAMAGYRLIPALHKMFQAVSKIRSFVPELDTYLGFLREFPTRNLDRPQRATLDQELVVSGVNFSYDGTQAVLRDIELTIARQESIGLVGHTGSGKSTLVDILMGLLSPTDGEFRLDGVVLGEDGQRRWRSSVGYVPQDVYLRDDTILANIAFGLSDDEVDHQAVAEALRIARLDDFVSTLPEGWNSAIGEKGVCLSGGQRQRLGIARALYSQPEMLIFDEATSSLDSITEKEVMAAIEALSGSRTIVMVAHRLDTVRACDRIYLMEQGRIIASGSYDELLATSSVFQALAQSPVEKTGESVELS